MPAFPLRPHPHLYQINTYAWLESLSARLGRPVHLGDVPDTEWDAIAALGFDVVWLMGVWRRSPISRRMDQQQTSSFAAYTEALPGWKPEDLIGSPYSVAAYEPDARVGSWSDVDAARDRLHQRKMGLFLDFVGNHTALDHPWIAQHPEFYVQGSQADFEKDPGSFYKADSAQGPAYIALGRDPYFPPWDDVAQLNHFSPAMRAAQLDGLRRVAAHCDGVRCDMAMLQLNDIFQRLWRHLIGDTPVPAREFWTDARAAVPDLVLLAEAYWGTEERLIELGFSFVYDKDLYDAVRASDLDRVRHRLSAPPENQSRFARFLENHDEPRFPAAFGSERLRSVATLMGTLPGMRFYQQGEELGVRLRTPIELRAVAAQPVDPASRDFFARLLAATRDPVFHQGQWSLVPVEPDGTGTAGNLLAWQWRSPQAWRVVVVNLSGETAQGHVQLIGSANLAPEYRFFDHLDGATYHRTADQVSPPGLFALLAPHQAHLFDVTPLW